jgi:hypothetical protein
MKKGDARLEEIDMLWEVTKQVRFSSQVPYRQKYVFFAAAVLFFRSGTASTREREAAKPIIPRCAAARG